MAARQLRLGKTQRAVERLGDANDEHEREDSDLVGRAAGAFEDGLRLVAARGNVEIVYGQRAAAEIEALAGQSVGACYGFISQGETSPAVLIPPCMSSRISSRTSASMTEPSVCFSASAILWL